MASRLGQVVDRLPADRRRREVRLDPCGDLTRNAGPAALRRSRPDAATHPATWDEVMDLALADVLLEGGQARRLVGAVEAADRHHRLAGCKLVTRGVFRT